MALIDLKSNLAWPKVFTRSNPPQTQGFDANMQVKGQSAKPSQFLEVSNPNNLQLRYINPILNLQGEQTPNSYIKQPFILRGIQRPGYQAKPQRWGFGMTFDDGFMRGGVVTATERALVDTLRIAKWMATPKGLLWNVKQLGLGFANPKVETVSGKGIPQTRLHIGPTTLLSVAGNAFGQHFVSHGLPFLSVLGNYGNVQIAKQLLWNVDPVRSNRLVSLKKDLFGDAKSKIRLPVALAKGLRALNNTIKDLNPVIGSLSGLGGANSVYGIGRTDILRRVDSTQWVNTTNVPNNNNIIRQYFSIGGLTPYKTANDTNDTNKVTLDTVSNLAAEGFVGSDLVVNFSKSSSPTNKPDSPTALLSNPEDLNPTIGKYATVAYGQLKKSGTGDFRNALPRATNFTGIAVDYNNENIEKVYKIGDVDEYNSNDFINFKFNPRPMGGSPSKNPIQFRAFLDSISDSFSPTWNAEFDQGRADARILYGAFARSVGISFRIAVFKKEQIAIVYDKMDQLAKLTMPDYSGETFNGRFCDVTIGNLYRNIPVYIDSLTYDWDSESPWELTDGQQVPMYVSVSVNCTWIGNKRPDQVESVFSLGSKT
jgi:hypothetical protein